MFLNFLGKFNFNPHSEIFFFLSSVSKILKKKILSKVIFDKLQFFRAFEYGLSNKTTSFEYSLVELVPLQAKTLLSTRIVKFDPTCVKVRLVRNPRMNAGLPFYVIIFVSFLVFNEKFCSVFQSKILVPTKTNFLK